MSNDRTGAHSIGPDPGMQGQPAPATPGVSQTSQTVVHETEHHVPRTPIHQGGTDRSDASGPVNVSVGSERRDRVRWGPIWAGLVVALSTFLLLELATFALGWWDVAQPGEDSDASWISGVVGLAAFLVGGLTAGATAMWRGADDGLLHGILVWALGVVSIVLLTVLGGGALFGAVADVLGQITSLQQIQGGDVPDVQAQEAVDTARDAAQWAVLGLGLSVAAAAIGGLLGAKMWPRKHDTEPNTVELPR